MAKTDTLILSFGVPVETELGLLLVELDPQLHKDDDGNQVARFPEGTDAFILVHHDPAIAIVRLGDTAGGDTVRIGAVSRSATQEEVTFTHAAAEISLPHIPNGLPSASWRGRSSGLVSKGKNKIAAPGAPCLGNLTYHYSAVQYRYRPPVMNLALKDEWPVDMVIKYRARS